MKGILFSAPMVRAILGGRKSVTRRLMKEQPGKNVVRMIASMSDCHFIEQYDNGDPLGIFTGGKPVQWTSNGRSLKAPYRPGEIVYAKETWADNIPGCPNGISYKADHIDPKGDGPANPMKWKSSMFMPSWASRIHLEIVSVRTERLQEITEEEAIREGAEWRDYGKDCYGQPLPGWAMDHPMPTAKCLSTARMAFANFINRLHGGDRWNLKQTNLWDENRWVFRIEFRRVK